MRALRLVAASLVLAPALLAAAPTAVAGNLTAGVGLGVTQDKVDSQGDSTGAYDLFARLRLGRRASGQLEIGKVDNESAAKYYTATALLVMDLTDPARGPLVPTVLVGVGMDHQDGYAYSSDISGQHIEAGLGLEYRAAGGLVIGFDARIGARQVDQTYYAEPVYDTTTGATRDGTSSLVPCDPDSCGTDPLWSPTPMHAGEYRSARITLAIHFQ